MPCMTKEGRCTREGVIYVMTCMKCKEDDRKVHYIGESARCGYDRGAEHWKALQRGDPESPLVEHNQKEHPNDPSTFSMEIVSYITRNMTRQATESVKIQLMSSTCDLLNRRGEWGQNLPPKLTIDGEDGDYEGKGQKDSRKKKRGEGAAGTVTSKGDDNGGGEGGRPQSQNPMVQVVQEAPIRKKRRLGPAPTIEPPKSRSLSIKEMLLKMAPNNAQEQRIHPTKCDQKVGSKSQSLSQQKISEKHGIPTPKGSIITFFKGSKSTGCNGRSRGQTEKGSVKPATTEGYKRRSSNENQPMLSLDQSSTDTN